jgi:hypothetical protein
MVLSHNSGLSITALIRSILQRHFSCVFLASGDTALMAFQDNLHVENVQGSSGGRLIMLSANCSFVNLTLQYISLL